MPLILMTSDSRNEMVEKHQQVPELFWFFTEVIGFSFTTVNLYSGWGAWGLGCCAKDAVGISITARAAINKIFFILIGNKINNFLL